MATLNMCQKGKQHRKTNEMTKVASLRSQHPQSGGGGGGKNASDGGGEGRGAEMLWATRQPCITFVYIATRRLHHAINDEIELFMGCRCAHNSGHNMASHFYTLLSTIICRLYKLSVAIAHLSIQHVGMRIAGMSLCKDC